MFHSQLVQVISALLLLYFLQSIFVSALNEIVSSFASFRSKFLYRSLEKILSDSQNHTWVEALYHHPLVSNLSEKKGRLPDYISSTTFATVITGNIIRHYEAKNGGASNASEYKRLNDALNDLREGEVKTMFQTFVSAGEGSFEKVKQNIGSWYDEYMTRVSSSYKKRNQRRLFLIAISVTILVNVDTIELFKLLWNYSIISDMITGGHFQQSGGGVIGYMLQTIRWANLPFVWMNSTLVDGAKILGWLVTALATTFGSQYWFDILGRMINLKKLR